MARPEALRVYIVDKPEKLRGVLRYCRWRSDTQRAAERGFQWEDPTHLTARWRLEAGESILPALIDDLPC